MASLGFSSANPLTDTSQGGKITASNVRRFSGGGGSSSQLTPQSSVSIKGNTVFINGQGYSVEPSLQAKFIQRRTSGYGSSAQSAIKQAQKAQQEQEQRRQAELRKQQEEAKRLSDQLKKAKRKKGVKK